MQAYDPEATKVAKGIFGNQRDVRDQELRRLKGADAWRSSPSGTSSGGPISTKMRKLMRSPVIFDGRNLFTPEQMKQSGFTYYSIGRH